MVRCGGAFRRSFANSTDIPIVPCGPLKHTVIAHVFIWVGSPTWDSFLYIISLLFQSHIIQNLETYTQYLVSLQVFNPEGAGPNTTVLVMTDEGGK